MGFYAPEYKITHSSVVLLALSDSTEGPVDFNEERLVQTVNPIRGANPIHIPRGNVSHSLTFSRVVVFETAAAARAFRISHALAVAALSKANVSLEDADSHVVTTFYDAVIMPGGFQARCDANLFKATYHLVGILK